MTRVEFRIWDENESRQLSDSTTRTKEKRGIYEDTLLTLAYLDTKLTSSTPEVMRKFFLAIIEQQNQRNRNVSSRIRGVKCDCTAKTNRNLDIKQTFNEFAAWCP